MASPKTRKTKAATPAAGGFSAAEVAAFAAAKDSGHRNPALVRRAFMAQPIVVGAITLRPITLSIYMLLEEIESPLIEEAGQEADDFTIRDMAAAVYILSHDEETVMASLDKSRSAFDRAVLKWAASVPAPDLMELGQAVAKSMADALATVLPSEKKTGTVAPDKSSKAARATASAGP